ncbi:unnamed protein product, partial [Ostreobium quekettii]
NLFSLECAFSNGTSVRRSVAKAAVSLAFPFVVMALFFVKWTFSWLKNRTAMPKDYLACHLSISTLSVLYIFYVDITDNAARVFNCTPVDVGYEGQSSGEGSPAEKYWVEDTGVTCWTGHHLVLATAAAAPLLLLVCLGFPLWILYIARSSGSTLTDRSVAKTHGFLYWSYNDRRKFWEAFILARKGILAGVSVFSFSLGPDAQGFLSLAILFSAGVGHALGWPFETHNSPLNFMEMLSIVSSFWVFFVGGLFSNPSVAKSETVKEALAVLLIVQVVSVFLYIFVRLMIEGLREVVAGEGKGWLSRKMRSVAEVVLRALLKVSAAFLRLSKRIGTIFVVCPTIEPNSIQNRR